MPELPEVRHIAQWLAPQLRGARIRRIEIVGEGGICLPQGEAFLNRELTGRLIRNVSRRGKLIYLVLDDGRLLAVHLKMTGQLWIDRDVRHVRVIVRLDDGRTLQLADARKFGWVRLWTADDFAEWEKRIGPEPVPSLPDSWLASIRGRRTVKAFLLDQSAVAGIGNIYADEILFRARLHPTRRLDSLSPPEKERLRDATVAEMTAAVNERSGEPDQKRIGGGDRTVKKLFNWKVFQRPGESCVVCGDTIVRSVVAQRGTYSCPTCQI